MTEPADQGAESPPSAGELADEAGHLPDDSVVIRGGQMNLDDLKDSVETYADRTQAEYGVPTYGFSVFSVPGLDADGVAMTVKAENEATLGKNVIPQGCLRPSTARAIREPDKDGRAFTLVRTFPRTVGHYTLTFPSEPTESDWERVLKMFGPAQPNPARELPRRVRSRRVPRQNREG